MNRLTKTILASITILGSACQSNLPSRVDVSVSGLEYSTDNNLQNSTSEIESLDGTGNNIAHPEWGSVNQRLLRFSPASYADGISSPAGAARPSPRSISNTFSAGPEGGIQNDRDFSAFVYAWGQFIDHDMDLTETMTPREAFPIEVPAGDAWFDPAGSGGATIPLSRSKYDPSSGTAAGNPRQQLNSITAFLDASQIYGVDPGRAAALREFSGGRLKLGSGNLLPFNTDGFPNANDAHVLGDDQLFLAGDIRANENPELASLHTLFVREHNRIAARTAQRHPDWTDEQLFQQARRLVIAEIQKITYEDFLPALLGKDPLPAYGGYRADVDPGIATEFSTAAFRVGHSMLGDDIEFLDNDGGDVREAVSLRDSFFNPAVLGETDIDPILKYLASDEAQEIDTKVVDDVRNFLFGRPGQGGFDLAALNIQRGRDHGLADYNTVRSSYGLPRVSGFDQITSDKALQASLSASYGGVDDIDLWIGGLAEDHLPGGSLGPTFTAILVDQFTRLRDGDRFWYQGSLSGRMLQDVEDTSLADIIRFNTKLTKLQEDVFFFNESTTVIVEASPGAADRPDDRNGQRSDGRRQPSPSAVEACADLSMNSACSFVGRNQDTVSGTCEAVQNSQLACFPRERRPGP